MWLLFSSTASKRQSRIHLTPVIDVPCTSLAWLGIVDIFSSSPSRISCTLIELRTSGDIRDAASSNRCYIPRYLNTKSHTKIRNLCFADSIIWIVFFFKKKGKKLELEGKYAYSTYFHEFVSKGVKYSHGSIDNVRRVGSGVNIAVTTCLEPAERILCRGWATHTPTSWRTLAKSNRGWGRIFFF